MQRCTANASVRGGDGRRGGEERRGVECESVGGQQLVVEIAASAMAASLRWRLNCFKFSVFSTRRCNDGNDSDDDDEGSGSGSI